MKTKALRALVNLVVIASITLLTACGGGGSSSITAPVTPVTPVPTASAISLSASLTAVASDNSNTTTITATVTDASNAAVSGVPVTFSVDTGILSAATARSDSTGKAVATFSAGANASTRTATVVAAASGKSTQIPIRITGSTLTVNTTSNSLVVGGPVVTLTVLAKNSAGTPLSGQTITIAQTGSGSVTLAPSSGTTDASGVFTTAITALAPSTAGNPLVLTISGIGETRTVNISVAGPSTAFQIATPSADPTLNGATIGVSVPVSVVAPSPTTSVTFVTTLGAWQNGSNVIVVPVSNGSASASLSATSSGTANIQAFDSDPTRQATRSDSRSVFFTAACATAARVTLQSTPSVVAPNSGGTSSLSTLLASVTDPSGNPVGGCPIAFSIVNPTGGGESVSPAVVLTAAVVSSSGGLGQATATFTSGSLPSAATGVQIRATVIKTPPLTNISTGTGTDATVVIGGTAGSVTIGVSTVISDSAGSTIYTLPMSVLVADSNGNPVANSVVSLSAWPIAFNVGGNVCAGTNATTNIPNAPGTFYFNEDVNENLIRDQPTSANPSLPDEVNGFRRFYPSGGSSGLRPPASNTQLTPPNSAAGTLPATVTTNGSGVASFTLTYTKSSAAYIVDRIRARTVVQGTQTVGEIRFVLPFSVPDIGPPCLLGSSSFN